MTFFFLYLGNEGNTVSVAVVMYMVLRGRTVMFTVGCHPVDPFFSVGRAGGRAYAKHLR